MGLADTHKVDIVWHDPKHDSVVLTMVEDRPWGERGELILQLQAKLKAYLAYALDGQLLRQYPEMKGKPVRFELRYEHELGPNEMKFIEVVKRNWLEPEKIVWQQSRLGPASKGK